LRGPSFLLSLPGQVLLHDTCHIPVTLFFALTSIDPPSVVSFRPTNPIIIKPWRGQNVDETRCQPFCFNSKTVMVDITLPRSKFRLKLVPFSRGLLHLGLFGPSAYYLVSPLGCLNTWCSTNSSQRLHSANAYSGARSRPPAGRRNLCLTISSALAPPPSTRLSLFSFQNLFCPLPDILPPSCAGVFLNYSLVRFSPFHPLECFSQGRGHPRHGRQVFFLSFHVFPLKFRGF